MNTFECRSTKEKHRALCTECWPRRSPSYPWFSCWQEIGCESAPLKDQPTTKHKFKILQEVLQICPTIHLVPIFNEQMNLHFIEDLNSNWYKIWVYWPWWFWHSGWLGLAWHLSLLRAESEPTVVDASTPALSLSYVLPIVARIYIDIAFKSKLLFHWNFLFYVSK